MDYLAMAENGTHPLLLTKMGSGYAVLADTQFLPGYCILLASPKANHLTDLPMPHRMQFLQDMSLIGEALEQVLRPQGLVRINYEILGNTDAYLHAHVIPRYEWEPDELRGYPAFNYPRDRWTDPSYRFDTDKHDALRAELTKVLTGLVSTDQ